MDMNLVLHAYCVLVRGNSPTALLGSHIPIELSTHSPRMWELGGEGSRGERQEWRGVQGEGNQKMAEDLTRKY